MYPQLEIFSGIAIPTFFLMTSLCACLALLWSKQRAHLRKLDEGQTLDLTLLMMIGAFVGARVFHILFEEPRFYAESPLQILFFWNGGFVFYGGLFGGAAIGIWVARRWQPQHWRCYFDHFAPIVSLLVVLGRLGCFLNGCCFGATCELPWALTLPDDLGQWLPRHPTQLYMSLGELGLLGLLLFLERRSVFGKTSEEPRLFPAWLFGHSLLRFTTEFFRADDRGPQWLLSQASWISLFLMIGAAAWLVRPQRRL